MLWALCEPEALQLELGQSGWSTWTSKTVSGLISHSIVMDGEKGKNESGDLE